MSASPYTDPENAALELIAATADTLDGETDTDMLRGLCSPLRRQRCFAGLCWPDARLVALAIVEAATTRTDAAYCLVSRSRDALAGTDGAAWWDRDKVAQALTIAADVLGL